MTDIDNLINIEASTNGARPTFVLPPPRINMVVGEIARTEPATIRVYTRMSTLGFSAQVMPHHDPPAIAHNAQNGVAYSIPPSPTPEPPDDRTEIGITNMEVDVHPYEEINLLEQNNLP